ITRSVCEQLRRSNGGSQEWPQSLASLPRISALASGYDGTSRQPPWYRLLNQMAEFPWNKPTPHNWPSFHPEGENHEDASCCCHSCDSDRSPRSGEGEAGAIGAPARLSVVGATRLLPRLPSEGLVPRRRLVSALDHQGTIRNLYF